MEAMILQTPLCYQFSCQFTNVLNRFCSTPSIMYEVGKKKRYNMKYYHRDFVWHDVHLADVLSRKSLVAGDNCHRDVTWLSFKFTSASLFLP